MSRNSVIYFFLIHVMFPPQKITPTVIIFLEKYDAIRSNFWPKENDVLLPLTAVHICTLYARMNV